eukprot:886245-Rhodomonas_salina.1
MDISPSCCHPTMTDISQQQLAVAEYNPETAGSSLHLVNTIQYQCISTGCRHDLEGKICIANTTKASSLLLPYTPSSSSSSKTKRQRLVSFWALASGRWFYRHV